MKRKYSQIFLKDRNIAENIVEEFIKIVNNNSVTEIGPGKGILTDFLYEKYHQNLIVIDIDPLMIDEIKKKYPYIKAINSDFLKLDLSSIGTTHFIGNLPYHISTAIIEKLINYENFISGVFMLQKEVCRKLVADEKKSEYGYISAVVNLFYRTTYLFDVSKESFSPVPEVDSGVIKIERKCDKLPIEDFRKYIKFISYAFRHKRKTLVNSVHLSNGIPKKYISELLKENSISENIRAEELSPEILFNLSKKITGIWI